MRSVVFQALPQSSGLFQDRNGARMALGSSRAVRVSTQSRWARGSWRVGAHHDQEDHRLPEEHRGPHWRPLDPARHHDDARVANVEQPWAQRECGAVGNPA